MLQKHPDEEYVHYLISGVEQGFHNGMSVLPENSYVCKNNLSARRDPEKTKELLGKEIEKGYAIGPFSEPPFNIYRINPISLAQKKYSLKKRLVVDMSAPHNDPEIPSINSLISKDDFRLSYVRIDDAIRIIQKLGRGTYLCKTDLVDAFKNLPVREDIIPYQGIAWDNKYYFFTRLVFGCTSSPKIFDALSKAIVWIAQNNYDIEYILHLLDDFLTCDPPGDYTRALRTMAVLKLILKKLNIAWAEHKTIGPEMILEYLGIILRHVAHGKSTPPG